MATLNIGIEFNERIHFIRYFTCAFGKSVFIQFRFLCCEFYIKFISGCYGVSFGFHTPSVVLYKYNVDESYVYGLDIDLLGLFYRKSFCQIKEDDKGWYNTGGIVNYSWFNQFSKANDKHDNFMKDLNNLMKKYDINNKNKE